jgi:type I restriction enzyme S subunit
MEAGRYNPYPAYKLSGVEWLGEFPSHWKARRAKAIFQRVQRPPRESDGIVTAFRDGEVTLRSKRRTEGFTNAVKEIGYQGVRKNDLLVHAMDGFAGAIGVSDSDGKCSPVCSVCIPIDAEKTHMPYYGYLVRQLAVTDFITSLAKGIRERSTEFRYSEFSVLPLALPPLLEQTQIAAFLDHETAQIDALIAKQERLIALLEEKRQAVISHAVTKGLNPDAPLRRSGIDWLGDVPAHWAVSYLGFEASIKARLGWKGLKADEYVAEGYIFLATPNIKGREIDMENVNYITKKRYEESPEIALEIGDVLVTKDGSTTGTTNVVRGLPRPATVNSSIAVIRRLGSLDSDYLYYFFKSEYTQNVIKRMQDGMGVPHLFQADLRKFRVLLPPMEEQASIAAHLEEAVPMLDDLFAKAQSAITLLKERRTALISAAVTGKIDVRDWQPPKDISDQATDQKEFA